MWPTHVLILGYKQVNESALAVDIVESDVGPINKAALHVALTVAAFLVEDQVKCLEAR